MTSDFIDNLPEPDYVSDDRTVALYCGDCLDILPKLPEKSADAVITDPPYGMNYQSARRTDSERFDRIANDEQPFIWWAKDAYKITADGGCSITFCRWDQSEAFRSAMMWSGYKVKSQLVWDRGNHGLGDLKGTPAPRHDTVWFATKDKFKFSGRRPPSVLYHMRLAGNDLTHPNEKPVSLMCELAQDYCPNAGIIVDPFMGSGTTGVACVKTCRRFVGIEISRQYFDIAVKRIKDAFDGRGLFASPSRSEHQLEIGADHAP